MINTQLGRRNLPPQQRIAVVKKFEKKIREQGKENQSEAGRNFGNGKTSSSPIGEELNDKKIRTDKELAKLANVGTGTIARFNRVMSSEDEKQQRIAVVKKFEKKIQEQARGKLIKSGKLYGENHPKNESLSPNGETLSDFKKIHTDKMLAKLAGVGTGTIARFNRVMSSDNEELDKVSMCQIRHNGKFIKTKQKTEKVFSRR